MSIFISHCTHTRTRVYENSETLSQLPLQGGRGGPLDLRRRDLTTLACSELFTGVPSTWILKARRSSHYARLSRSPSAPPRKLTAANSREPEWGEGMERERVHGKTARAAPPMLTFPSKCLSPATDIITRITIAELHERTTRPFRRLSAISR